MAVSINASGTFSVVTRATGADCENTTNWSLVKLEGGGGTPSIVNSVGSTDLFVEGSNAIETTTNKQRIMMLHTPGTSYDFTSGSTGSGTVKIPGGLFWAWSTFLASGSLLTEASGGYQMMLGDGTNRGFWNIAGSDTYLGGFKKWAISIDLSTRFTTDDAGTPQIGNITEFGVVTDVGTATTRFANFVIDAYDIGDGLTFTGSTTSDALFLESFNAQDTNKVGILSNENGIIFAQGNIEFDGSSQVSDGETMVFTDTVLDSTYTYTCDFTGSHTLTNSTIGTAGGVGVNMDTSSATSFSMSGGSIYGPGTVTTATGQTLDNVVLTSRTSITIGNTSNGCAAVGCGQITVTGEVDSWSVSDSTVTSDAVLTTANTNKVDKCSLTKHSTNTQYAVELTGSAATYSWSNTLSGFRAGATGSPITPYYEGSTANGNEALFINAASGTFNISVADGASVPSVALPSGSTATVNVTANQITLQVTVLDDVTGSAIGTTSRVYLHKVGDTGTVYLNGATNASGVISTQIDYDADTNVTGWARDMDLSGEDYVPADINGQYTSSGFSITVRLKRV